MGAVVITDRPVPDPAALTGQAVLPALRELPGLLRQAGFDEHSAARAVGAANPRELLSSPGMYAFFSDWPLGGAQPAPEFVLTSLFLLNRTVEPASLCRVLPAQLRDVLSALGLLIEDERGYRASVSITPYRNRYYLSDQIFANPSPRRIATDPPSGAVMPPHLSSLLALDIIEGFSGRVLDIGCGNGFLALSMPDDCERVVGVDLNPRCVAYARANSVVNSAVNTVDAEFEIGDFAQLSAGQQDRYDRFVFNAPTLPRIGAEETEFGQMTARQVLRIAVDVARKVLRPGGEAHIIAVVEVAAGLRSAAVAVRQWFADLDVGDFTVREYDAPQLNITERELTLRRLSGRSILVSSSAQARQLLDALANRGIGSVRTAQITLHVR